VPDPETDFIADDPAPLRGLGGWWRSETKGTGGHRVLGLLVDAFAGIATLDGRLAEDEAELVLDLLRSAYPEADHGWLARRVQRAVRDGRPLPNTAAALRELLDDAAKMAVGLQLYTLVDAAGRTDRSRTAFEVFMRRLGRPEDGNQIVVEMADLPTAPPAGFERVIFGADGEADVRLPAEAAGRGFRVYRAADLILVRNTGAAPLWVRGRSLERGHFLRMRARQQLVVPGWTLICEDLVFFLNVARTGNRSTIFLAATDEGWRSERARSRQSIVRIRFGLGVEVEALKPTSTIVIGRGPLRVGKSALCLHTDRLSGERGFTASLDALRRRAAEAGGRFRLTADQRDFRVSNDPAVLDRGDLLISPGLAPRAVMRIRFDPEKRRGDLFVREADGPVIADDQPVRVSAELHDGSLIRLSRTQALRCRFKEGFLNEERNLIETLRVEDLGHDFGKDARALDNLSFEIRRGEMMAIIGPSGSGKSTLLAVLAGHRRPTRGRIRLNDASLYRHRQELIPFIANMPQEEALNPQLTVREHLVHATAVRRATLPAGEVERRARGILAELGLQGIARRRVGSPGEKALSGGERSRLNLGLDLGSDAEVFLFDEPISGLSSKDSEHVAETLKSLSRDKIVIASLHRPGANVLAMCDKVLLLDHGGRLAFFGSPDAMIDYFRKACEELGLPHPGIAAGGRLGADFVFDVLETPLAQIGGGEDPSAARRFPPSFWQERFESRVLVHSLDSPIAPPSRIDSLPQLTGIQPGGLHHLKLRALGSLRVFRTQLARSLLSKLRNRGTVYSTLVEAPLLAALIAITLRASPEGSYEFSTALHVPAYLFLSATVAMFLGLTNSATEILRDRPVIRRERNTRRSPLHYVTAKFTALTLLAAVQCLVYTAVGHRILEIHGTLWEQWQWMTLTACAGTAMALLVSALVRTERAALTAVPLLLVPQMLLAGALVPFDEMNRGLFSDSSIERHRGGVPVPARWMPLRWAYEGMVVTQATRNPYDLGRIRIQRRVERIKELPSALREPVAERFEVLKRALQLLSGADATGPREAMDLAARLTQIARGGTMIELEGLEIRPDSEDARPLSDFFVNKRVELMIEEAESYRTDYRNEKLDRRSDIFLAELKPLGDRNVSTILVAALVLIVTAALTCGATTLALIIQNRSTR
jgi:ABC-type multidrug transport system ATPase subunit